jgi:hypothetical protein
MVDWVQKKPEVITYLRSQYSSDALFEWVGEPEGDVDYGELLRSKGVEVPATTVADSGSMDGTADRDVDDNGTMEEKVTEEDIAEGTPVQGSTTGDVDPESQAPMGTHGKSQAVSHGQSPQESPPVTGEVMEKSPPVTVNESREEPPTVTEKDLRVTKLPKAIVEAKSVKIPVKIASESEGVIQQSPAREKLVEELKKLQTHTHAQELIFRRHPTRLGR